MYEIRRDFRILQTASMVPTPAAAPPAPTATWNSTDEDGEMTFSGGDLIATGTGTNQWRNCRIVTGQTAGKYYAEFRFTAATSAAWSMIGVGTAYPQGSLGQITPGPEIRTIGWSGDGTVIINAANVAPASNPFGVNDWLAMAVDLDNDRIWFKNITDAGTWNANSGDPTTPSTGISISSIIGTSFKAMATIGYVAGDICEANFGATTYQATRPVGYLDWPL